MAIAFELVINFGSDRAAADAACLRTGKHPALTAGQHRVRLHEPLITTVRGYHGEPYLETSIIPVGVGWGVAADRGHERLRLAARELSELGHGLYQLLASSPGTGPPRSDGIPRGALTRPNWERTGPTN